MEQVFQELFKFTDYVLAHAGRIFVSIVVLFILWALLKSLLSSIVGGTAEIFGLKRKGRKRRESLVTVDAGRRPEKTRGRRREPVEEPQPEQPKPIMVAHPLDIKDEASRRLFEEEVEREKEQMRLRSKEQ